MGRWLSASLDLSRRKFSQGSTAREERQNSDFVDGFGLLCGREEKKKQEGQ